MKNMIKTCAVFFLLIAAGVMMVPSVGENAAAQECLLQLCIEAAGGDDVQFPFGITFNGMQDGGALQGNTCDDIKFFSGPVLEVFEGEVPGWLLADVVCESDGGMNFTSTEDGVSVVCTNQAGSEGICTFVNVQERNIPTLSEWGMITAAAGLAMIGVFFAVRRRRAAVTS